MLLVIYLFYNEQEQIQICRYIHREIVLKIRRRSQYEYYESMRQQAAHNKK